MGYQESYKEDVAEFISHCDWLVNNQHIDLEKIKHDVNNLSLAIEILITMADDLTIVDICSLNSVKQELESAWRHATMLDASNLNWLLPRVLDNIQSVRQRLLLTAA